MNGGAMLNAYPDSLGGTLWATADFLARPECAGAFQSFYILPSLFHTDLDRGFSVISYDLNRMLADRACLDRLRALGMDLKLDIILNHLSVLSPQFQDLLKNGEASPFADFFIDWNKRWAGKGELRGDGVLQPDAALLRDMFFRKPGLPVLMVRMPDGRDKPYWNTFYQEVRYLPPDAQDLMEATGAQYAQAKAMEALIGDALARGVAPADIDFGAFAEFRNAALAWLAARRRYLGQMDLNLESPRAWDFYAETLGRLAEYGASIVRLDAFAYASKIPGRRNFLNEPETWDALSRVRELADARGLSLLPEIHASYAEGTYRTLAGMGYMTYDFFLPGLLIDAIENADGETLARWARELVDGGIRTVNMLGCHDGIPLLDLKGLLPEARIQALIDLVVKRGGMVKDLHGQKNVYYQVNATYFSALGADARKLLLARAIQLFMPGKPQVWYLDLFAGENDEAAVLRGGAAGHKEINRTNLSREQMEARLSRPVTREQLRLLRLRNACPAFGFDAALTVARPAPHLLEMTWERAGHRASLAADLKAIAYRVEVDGAVAASSEDLAE